LKNLLTNRARSAIIYRLTARESERAIKGEKKRKKLLKNPLTNRARCDIIYRLSQREASAKQFGL